MLGKTKHKIIDIYRGTNVVKDFEDISRECLLGFDNIKNIQRKNLIKLLVFAKKNVNFYSEKLCFVSDSDIKTNPFEVLLSLPIISKIDYLNNIDDFISRKKNKYIKNNTGGSTGDPLTYLVDINCISRTKAFDLYWWNLAFGYTFGDRVLVIGGSSVGKSNSFHLKIYNYLQSKIFLEGGNISREKLYKNVDILCNTKYDVIYAYPSSILMYIQNAKVRGLKFKGNLKGIATTSENLTSTVRSSIETFFHAPVFDVYGARDGGIVADECEHQTGLHYNFQDCYVEEYYGSEDMKVPELVLTNLISYSQPMIRYRVGDLGKISYLQCACGNPLPRIIDFTGRTRDLLYLSNGRIIHGSLFNKIVSYYPSIKQFQTIYDECSLKFIMVVSPDMSKKEEKKFISNIVELTGIKDIIIDYSGSFEYTDAGKLKTVVNKKR